MFMLLLKFISCYDFSSIRFAVMSLCCFTVYSRSCSSLRLLFRGVNGAHCYGNELAILVLALVLVYEAMFLRAPVGLASAATKVLAILALARQLISYRH